MLSTLITIAIVLVIVGFVLWLINAYVPMYGPIKAIFNLVVIIALILWILSVFGIINIGSIGNLGHIKLNLK